MSHDSIDLWGLIALLWGFTDSKMENIFRICLGFFKYDYGQKEEKEIRKAKLKKKTTKWLKFESKGIFLIL